MRRSVNQIIGPVLETTFALRLEVHVHCHKMLIVGRRGLDLADVEREHIIAFHEAHCIDVERRHGHRLRMLELLPRQRLKLNLV